MIAEAFSVDVHLAHTYLMNNYENCLEREECLAAYENIAVELMRAMNFYRFSNPDSTLSDLWLCGGGAVIRPLADSIGEMLDMELHPASELVRRSTRSKNATVLCRRSALRSACKGVMQMAGIKGIKRPADAGRGLSGISRKGRAGKARGKLPEKTTINLVIKDEKQHQTPDRGSRRSF